MGDAQRDVVRDLVEGIEPFGRQPIFLTTSTARNVGTTTSHVDVSLWFAFTASTTDHLAPDPREFAAIGWWALDQIAHGPGTRFDPNLPLPPRPLRGPRRVARNDLDSVPPEFIERVRSRVQDRIEATDDVHPG